MAKVVRLIDDFTGKELGDGEGLSVRFSIQDSYYEMDLGADSFAKLEKVMAPWIEKSVEVDPPRLEPVRPVKATRGTTRPAAAEGSMSREQREAIRAWANANGFVVGDRGRIKAEVIAAFEEAHKG